MLFTSKGVYAGVAPVGLVDTRILPALSAATHNALEMHEMPLICAEPSMLLTVQAPLPPVGFVEVIAFPALSVATQRLVVGQEIEVMLLEPSTVAAVHVPLGLVVVETCPLLPTTAHKPVVAVAPGEHDIAF